MHWNHNHNHKDWYRTLFCNGYYLCLPTDSLCNNRRNRQCEWTITPNRLGVLNYFTHYKVDIITFREAQDNLFTSVCHSIHGKGICPGGDGVSDLVEGSVMAGGLCPCGRGLCPGGGMSGGGVSVWRGGGLRPEGVSLSGRVSVTQTLPSPATAACGTHPTGMHSCFTTHNR